MTKRDASTLLHRLYLWSKDSPSDAMYHTIDDQGRQQVYTVDSVFSRVHRIALALKSYGLNPSDKVLIYAGNSPERIQWELGTLLAGGVITAVTQNSVDSDLKHIILESKPSIILMDNFDYEQRLAKIFPEGIDAEFVSLQNQSHADSKAVWDELWIEQNRSDQAWISPDILFGEINSTAPAWLVYTSGTTGVPKGAFLSLENLTFAADRVAHAWNLPFGKGILFSFLPLSHVAEKLHTLGVGISNRYEVHICRSADRFFDDLRRVRPTLFFAVPRIYERLRDEVMRKVSDLPKVQQKVLSALWDYGQEKPLLKPILNLALGQVRYLLGLDQVMICASGAAKLSAEVAAWFSVIGIPIHEVYGMTETSGIISLSRLNHPNSKTVGLPVPGIDVNVASDGEIRVKGKNVFLGYIQPDDNKDVLVDDWLRTGDLGEWSKQGDSMELSLVGRSREIIKLSNGRMIAPVPIEGSLRNLKDISQVCLVGDDRAYVTALITLSPTVLEEVRFKPGALEGVEVVDSGVYQSIQKQIDSVNSKLTKFEQVRSFRLLSSDFTVQNKELTPTFKLRRSEIHKNYKNLIESMYE